MRGSIIDELRAGFEEPFWALGGDASVDRGTVVVSWPSVPVELIRAAGFSPVFARGRATPTLAADRVLERDLFPNRLQQLAGREPRAVVDLDAGGVLEDLEALRCQIVAHEYAGHAGSSLRRRSS